MIIGIVGLGYVGLVTGAVLADQGHYVIGVDIDEKKVNGLNCNRIPIYEPGLDELIMKNKKKIQFTTNYSDLSDANIVFIAVSTPTINGKIFLDYIYSAGENLQKILNKESVIVIKSTVVPGTSRKVKEITKREVIVNPEFLREGSAITDTKHPERIVIGGDDEKAIKLIEDLWSFTNSPIIKTSMEEAELIKYAANSFLALKISFINEIANLCEKIPNCDINNIAKAIGMDKRISPYFLNAGLGFGGSCFPKDTLAITSFAKDLGERLHIVEAAIEVNNERPFRAVKMMEDLIGKLENKSICILGIAFKPNTDDTRESVGLKIAKLIREKGGKVIVYDPKAKADLEMVSLDECINKADGIIIATEWDEFRGLEDRLKGKYVVDGRRILNYKKLEKGKFKAIGVS